MCRLSGYLGPETTIDAFLVKPSHSLKAQSRHPRELPPDVLNADGYGYAWYPNAASADAEKLAGPAVYRSILPMWGDENLHTVSPYIRTHCIVASTRSATSDMPTGISNTAPFVRGHVSFVHNGFIAGFHTKMMRGIRAELAELRAAQIRGNTDSEHLFALIDQVRGGLSLVEGVRRGLCAMRDRIEAVGEKGQLNVIVSDGETMVASRYAVGQDAPSLYICDNGVGDARIASEALVDGASWTAVPSGSMVVVDRATRPIFAAV